jgi:hypothetical protein
MKPIPEMTNEEISAELAEWIHPKTLTLIGNYYWFKDGTKWNPCENKNLCQAWECEEKVHKDRALYERYCHRLLNVIVDTRKDTHLALLPEMIHATARQRCEAILQVIRGGAK